jgi:NAD(P)-dependent dehydrogenase (short-subunit alcohol dehydrogenase family)
LAIQLQNQVAIVTGGGQEIGRMIARAFVSEGAKVVIAEINPDTGQKTAEEIGTEYAHFHQTDVREITSIQAMIAATLERWGRLDILVNNAGVFGRHPSETLPEAEWDRVMDTNLKGTFLCSQAVGQLMIQQGSGRIINLSSINGLVGFPERLAYNCSKAGVAALTRVLACEWGKYNITVNAIAPGYVRTEAVDHHIALGWYDEEALVRRTPLGRLIPMEDIAQAAVYLASPAAANVSGTILTVDGGWVAYGYL